jgi:putative ABC transport system permease protein
MDRSAWRQAWRSLRRRPAFLAGAVLTLGLGAGLATAAWSLVDAVLIKPLPYPDADRLVAVYETSPAARDNTSLLAPGRLEDWNRLNRTFAAISGSYAENVTDTSGDQPERLQGRRVAPRFFASFGTAPLAGRTFTEAEELANGPGVAVIGERFWERRFSREPAAIGGALTIGGRSYTIVGVMPATFTAAPTDVWLPAQFSPQLLQARGARFLGGIGRLRPGTTVEQAARDLAAVQLALANEFPETDAGWSAEIRPLKDVRVGEARRGLSLVFGAVLLLWIVAVANVAGLTLVHAQRRARELAIRAALGASRARVAGVVAREGLLVAALGGVVGALVARWLVAAMPAALSTLPRIDEIALDLRALAFVVAGSVLAAGVFSVIPAVAGARRPPAMLLSGGGRSATARRHGVQKALVVGQVAASVLLVGSASLLLHGYYRLTRVGTGFDASQVVTFHVAARWDEDRTRIGRLQEQLVEALEALPHVDDVGRTNFLPAAGATLRYQVTVDGLAGPNADGTMNVGGRMISAGYLRAIRAPLLAGSWCASPPPGDFAAPRAAMVNRRFVESYGANQNLVGRALRLVHDPGAPYSIAGIVGDLVEDGHGAPSAPYVYTCDAPGAWPDPEYVARTSSATAFAVDLRRVVRELDSTRAIFGLRPLQDVLDGALDRPRLDAALLGSFAVAAVLLAALGLYSLFMLLVSERGREMAVRLAFGAEPGELARIVAWDAGRLLGAGLLLGVALSAAADRVLRGLLFGVGPLDARALAAAAITLALVSFVAVLGPALKAARTPPLDALRAD